MAVTTINNGRRYVVSEPVKAAWEHANQFFVTSAAAFMSAAFSMQHDVLPWWIAVPLAIGFEWTYLRGLANADKAGKTLWAPALNWSAMLTSIVYGVLYVLGHYGVIAETPDPTTALWLAFAHVLPMAVLSFCSANLRRIQKQAEYARELRKVAAQEEEERQETEYQRKLKRKRDETALDLERQYKEARMAEEVRAMRRTQRTANNVSGTVSAPNTLANTLGSVHSASGTPATTVREQLREQIVRTLREQPDANKSELAKSLGIGRTTLYEIIGEAKAAGELS